MNGKTNASYLDLTALPTVGPALLSPRPAWVFSAEGTAVLWANSAGMRVFAAASASALLGRRIGAANPLGGQLARLSRTLPATAPRLEILKFASGVSLTTLPAACQRLNLADGGRAVFAIAAPERGLAAEPLAARAEALATALAGDDGAAAILSGEGRVIGASASFSAPDDSEGGVRSVAFDADGHTLTLVVVDHVTMEDSEATSAEEAPPATEVSELRALVNARPSPSNVVPLPGAAGKPPPGQEQLSGLERDAFRRIAETLGRGGKNREEDPSPGSSPRSEPPSPPNAGEVAFDSSVPKSETPDFGVGEGKTEHNETQEQDYERIDDAGGSSPPPVPASNANVSAFEQSNEEFNTSRAAPPSQAAPVPDTAILDRLPIAIVVFREDETLYANNALVDLLGYGGREAFFAAGGREVLFAENLQASEVSAYPSPGSSLRTESPAPSRGEDRNLTARTADGGEIAVEARLQSVTWGNAPALMLSLREAVPIRSNASSPRDQVGAPGASGEGGGSAAGDNPSPGSSLRSDPPSPSRGGGSDTEEESNRRTLIEEIAAVQDRLGELEAILDVATDGVIVLEADGRIGNLNRAAEALFGVEAGDVLGRPFTELLAEESQRAARDYLDGLATNGVASVLNDGREVIGKVPQGGLIPLFMTMGRLGRSTKFCAVLRDITHWKNVEEELIAARRAAETANNLKSEFLAKISHEIRTPLNAIIGFSEVMMAERFGPIGTSRYKDYLRDIHLSGEHLMSLINDLLDLSKIEAGKLELDFEAVAANGVIQETVALMQPEANRARIIIRTSLADAMPKISADLRALRQILLNLLSNAIKFTPEGGQVIVSTAIEETGAVTIRVRDTGVGMSADEIETALMPFRQIATSGRERRDGTGLGLPLTKALVEANHATFAIESQIDQGTMVKVTFPKSAVVVG